MVSNYFSQQITRQLNQWLNKRIPAQPSVQLHSGNVFVFPNRLGALFLSLLAVIYIIGTNYQNNLILLVAYGLAGLGLVSVFHGFAQLYGLTIRQFGSEMCAVQDHTHVRIKVYAKRPIHGLTFFVKPLKNSKKHQVSLANATKVERSADQWIYHLNIPFVPEKRGVYFLPRLSVQTVYPLGIIRCWSVIDLAIEQTAYPQAISNDRRSRHEIGNDALEQTPHARPKEATTEEFDGISAYQQGAPMNRIAWKQSARTDNLLNKQFKSPSGVKNLHIRQYANSDKEVALSELCFAVQQLSSSKQRFSLTLDTQHIAAGSGETHRQHCLIALAKEPN